MDTLFHNTSNTQAFSLSGSKDKNANLSKQLVQRVTTERYVDSKYRYRRKIRISMDTQDRVQEENSYQLEGKKTVPKKFPQKNSQPRKLLKHDNKNRTMPSLFGGMIIG